MSCETKELFCKHPCTTAHNKKRGRRHKNVIELNFLTAVIINTSYGFALLSIYFNYLPCNTYKKLVFLFETHSPSMLPLPAGISQLSTLGYQVLSNLFGPPEPAIL